MSYIGEERIQLMLLGFRGFPNVQGGIETHVEHLAPILHNIGCDVEIIVRSPYMTDESPCSLPCKHIWSPKIKGLETIIHTLLGVLYAAVRRPSILHIHGIGPAIFTPLARLLGIRVVVTHHGPDYDRQKWGKFPRWVLKTGESLGAKYSNDCIVISAVAKKIMNDKYGRQSQLIPNGVNIPNLTTPGNILKQYDLVQKKYIISVSRLVPEKRHLDLIHAFNQTNLSDWKLVLVGASDHPDEYSTKVLKLVNEHSNIVSTGFQTGDSLKELYSNAGIFVLPSSHEGLPIALLEALSYGLNVIASDIPANLEIGLREDQYYPLGNEQALAERLVYTSEKILTPEQREYIRGWVDKKYNWHEIAKKTLNVYRNILI